MQLDLLVDGGWQHLDLAARGRGSIGKAIYGADRLVVGVVELVMPIRAGAEMDY